MMQLAEFILNSQLESPRQAWPHFHSHLPPLSKNIFLDADPWR